MNTMTEMLLYIFQYAATLYTAIALLRFLLQLSGADYYNPISQLIVKATKYPVVLLRKVAPAVGPVDLGSLLWALLSAFLLIQLAGLIFGVGFVDPISSIVWALLGLANLALSIYFFCLLLIIILSWIAPQTNHPGVQLIGQLIGPVIRPFQQILPPMGGFDFSPILAFLVINLLQSFVVRNLAISAKLIPALVPGF